jgi:hypothetical protein
MHTQAQLDIDAQKDLAENKARASAADLNGTHTQTHTHTHTVVGRDMGKNT